MGRTAILDRFRKQIAEGHPIIGSGAGTGLSAKCAEEGGASFLVIYNSGRYRMAGRSSMAGLMPYGDANAIMLEMGDEVLTVVDNIPVLAGVCGTDPFRNMPRFLAEVKSRGFAGVQNYPTVGLFEGVMRANLEETGLGFDKEVEMMGHAGALDLITAAYMTDEASARSMADAGVDILVPHLGLTASAGVGAKASLGLEEGALRVQAMHDAAKEVRDDILVLCHGGPITTPEHAAEVLRHVPGVVGFLGASSMERLPTEVAITERVRSFVDIPLGPRPRSD
jgi:predicted TIM-barrel enzyme